MDSTTAPVRPAPFQLFRNLAPPIEAALRASIYRFGVLVPIAKDQHGNILDGHQRARLADELGVKLQVYPPPEWQRTLVWSQVQNLFGLCRSESKRGAS